MSCPLHYIWVIYEAPMPIPRYDQSLISYAVVIEQSMHHHTTGITGQEYSEVLIYVMAMGTI